MAYSASVLAQVYHRHQVDQDEPASNMNLELLNEFIRQGYDLAYKLAISKVIDEDSIRIKNHQIAQDIYPLIDNLDEARNFNGVIRKVRQAYLQWVGQA